MMLSFCALNGLSGHEAGRALLERLYREKTGRELPEIPVTDRGKPYFADGSLHFSISHTKKHAFCVLSEHNVGIDAEELDRDISLKLAEKILSPGEKVQFDSALDQRKALLTFWVLKEAAAKLSGEGLQGYPNHTDFSLGHPGVTEIAGCLVAVLEEKGEDWMLFDTHAHMDDRAFDADREELLAALPQQGIGLVLNPGCSLASSRNVDALTKQYDYIYGAVGSHPDVADEVDEAVLEEYRVLCKQNPKIKAIGEIGLDYHYEGIPREIQQKAFRMQMALAREMGLPVIVHERDAHEDGMKIVEEFPEVTGVFHCYSGSAEMAKWLVARGWYIGFTGVLTFKNARKALEVAASIPLDRIVLETDCPYMSPEPFRGKRNDPGKLYRMAEKLAELRGLSIEETHRITMENGRKLYGI